MADQSHLRQDIHVVGSQDRGQDLQRRGEEAVQNFMHFLYENAPSSSNIVAYVAVLPLGAFLLGLSGVSFVGSLFGLAVTTPLFVLFSPVIVPAIFTIGLAVLGFLASGAFGIMALAAFSWIVNYLRGFSAGDTGTDLEHFTRWAHEKAGDMGQSVNDMGQDIIDSVREE